MDSCRSPPPFLAPPGAEYATDIEWDEPIFTDHSLEALNVTKSFKLVEGSNLEEKGLKPGSFPLGRTEVKYVARDASGNEAECIIKMVVQG